MNPRDEDNSAGKALVYGLISIGAALIGKKFSQPRQQSILRCPICLEHPKDVVLLTNCGHIIGRECLLPYFQERRCCPLCQTEPTEDEIMNNFPMHSVFDPVSLEPMKEAALLTNCGHTLDKESVIAWIQKTGACPECQAPATVNDIQKNHIVQAVIDSITK